MSRRVFDVGLDMGRIRNGLKHNKDSSKPEKRSKSYRSTHTKDDNYVDTTAVPSEHNAIVPHLKHRKSSPTIDTQRNGHISNHQSGIASPQQQPDPNSNFPQPPSHQSEKQPGIDSGERSLHSSQLYPPNDGNPQNRQSSEPIQRTSDELHNYDLKPPPPNSRVKNIDTLSQRLFSGEHLNVILKDPAFFLRFTAFLNRYRPHSAPTLVKYLEAQKAMKAVEYANALAETMRPSPGEHPSACPAATIDSRFEARSRRAFESLISDALPAYITNSLTKVVTEYMVKEITGTGLPLMRELVGGLAEVFCLADPSLEDCPIVYASEEFYHTTRYNRDDVLGRNCRFLQGPKTNKATIARLGAAIKSGQESCETILNYRRDGAPFMNLLLTAPLYDNRGSVRYFIGAQIDVSGLVDDGHGLESFARLLEESRPNRNRDSDHSDGTYSQKHLRTLNEFGQMLSLDESSLLQKPHSRTSSLQSNTDNVHRAAPNRPERMRQTRRVLGNDQDGERKDEWALSSIGPSGNLPGVYQNYLLVRPHPSLRIIFVSPALRIPGLLQSPFIPHIGGPQHVRDGLYDAFEAGAAVTAKVTWVPNPRDSDSSPTINGNGYDGSSRPASRRGGPNINNGGWGNEPKTRYISCTPLLGSDDRVGVWMVVMVEDEPVTGSLLSRTRQPSHYQNSAHHEPIPPTPSEYQRENPSSPTNAGFDDLEDDLGDGGRGGFVAGQQRFERAQSATLREQRKGKVGSEGGRLYAEFMKNAGGGSGSVARTDNRGTVFEGPEQKQDYLTNGGGVDGMINGENRFEEVRSP